MLRVTQRAVAVSDESEVGGRLFSFLPTDRLPVSFRFPTLVWRNALWWALTMVASIMAYLLSGSSAKVFKRRSQMPLSAHRILVFECSSNLALVGGTLT
jgi:hypothetical protein